MLDWDRDGRQLVENCAPIQEKKETVTVAKRTVVSIKISQEHCRKGAFVFSKLDK